MSKKQNIGIFLAIILLVIIGLFMLICLFMKPIYIVTFNTDGGTKLESIEVKSKETVAKPDNPTKDGYYFTGWYLDDELFDFDTKITGSITLTAKWQEVKTAMVTIKFDSLEGSSVEDITISYGDTLEVIPNPTKEGYTFIGWYYQNKAFDFSNPITEDIILVAKWKMDDTVKYTVSFNTDGAEEIESVTVNEGSTITAPSIPQKSGYKFIGWYIDEEEFDFATPITKDINLTAKWEKD